ncbi:MAG TPA: hypothetical protein VEJ00_14995 [Candidatus Acidoferrales bacterium]|nr:hypothetical protein [Candidatus Acidoferrales bacterium]
MQHNADFPLWLLLLGITVVALVVAWGIRAARQRTRDMTAIAQQLGLTFVGDHWRGPTLSPRFKMTLLQRMHGRFRNVMIGSSGGLEVAVFDYTYSQGKSSVTLTLACFSQDADLSPFELRPEGFFDKIGDAILHNDLDFDSHPDFSNRYHLRSPDEKHTRMLFSPSLLTYFEQIPLDRKWHVEASGPTLVLYEFRGRVATDNIPNFLNDTSSIARTILSSSSALSNS